MERKNEKENTMFIFALVLVVPALFLCGCADEEYHGGNQNKHDSTKWFTETELSAVGLSNLSAPTGLTGEMSTNTWWFNDGYAFTQPCSDDAILSQNALTYLNYFKENYNGYFGTVSIHATSSTSTYYYITQKNDIADYFDDNPSKLYKFYYVTNPEKTEKGYFVENSVYTFEIRYEFSTNDNQYLFKLFIEKADAHHNGQTQYFYKMK